MLSIKRLAVVGSAALCWGIAGASLAQPISDTVSVVGGPTITLPEDGTPQFAPAFFGPINAPPQVIQFTEPGTHVASDYLWIDANGFLNFESDQPEGVLPIFPLGPGIKTLDETGQPQEVSQFLFLNQGGVVPLIFVTSDIGEVPEPSTLMLLGAGIVGMLLGVRRSARGG